VTPGEGYDRRQPGHSEPAHSRRLTPLALKEDHGMERRVTRWSPGGNCSTTSELSEQAVLAADEGRAAWPGCPVSCGRRPPHLWARRGPAGPQPHRLHGVAMEQAGPCWAWLRAIVVPVCGRHRYELSAASSASANQADPSWGVIRRLRRCRWRAARRTRQCRGRGSRLRRDSIPVLRWDRGTPPSRPLIRRR
jgi:hypothetical protein